MSSCKFFDSALCRDILCIDKTGTLTMDSAIMVSHLDSWGSPKEKVLKYAFINAYFKTEQRYPIDAAILAHVYTNGYKFQPSKWKKIDEIPFDFTRRRVSVIVEIDTEVKDKRMEFIDRTVITKGALEEVVNICSFVEYIESGRIIHFSSEDHQRVINKAEELSDEGLRVIGVAMKNLKVSET